jgi:hypothetical protein
MNKSEYSISGGLFHHNQVLFADKDGKEQKYGPADFIELYIPAEDSGYRHYVSVDKNSSTGVKKVFRLVVNGKCQLLADNIEGSVPATGSTNSTEKFYYYLNDVLTPANAPAYGENSAKFITQCRSFFKDCPGLLNKIETQKYTAADLEQIVREFNACMKK